ncbi:MAG: EAL domain-containing protein [Xanthobacteraceae bacterium]
MRSLVRRHRLGDRMIAVVGMLVAAAVIALLGFSVLVAKRVDQESAVRELDLARRQLGDLHLKMKVELASFTRWDESVDVAEGRFDRSWLHQQFGLRLHFDRGHDRSFVLGADGTPVYASADGLMHGADLYRRVRAKIDPMVESVRRAYAADLEANLGRGNIGESPSRPKFEIGFRRVEDRVALVGVATIVPTGSRSPAGESNPAVAVTVAFLERELLAQLAREIAADRVSVSEGMLSAGMIEGGRVAVEIPLTPDESKAWLVWEPKAPGATMLIQLLPALFGVVALLGVITMVVLLYVRRTTERLNQSERRATELAYHDRLTGLPNRVQLLDTLTERLIDTNAEHRLALVLIDLDDFKDINDTLGHPTGDEVLFAIGERLTTFAAEGGMAVRFGGDEFALLIPVGQSNEEVTAICRRVSECMRAPVVASGQFLSVGATLGVAVAPEDGYEAEQLLRRADIALYRAKAENRGGYRMFDIGYEEILHKRSAIERDLSRALASEELALKFQPLYAADGERIVGVEALVRWNHPERGVVPPSEFIPIAEHTGLVVGIDEWVLRRACEHAAQWPGLSLAVNLSPSNFRQGNVAERLTRVLVETGFDPRRLEIEITEGMLLGATSEVLGELSELRRLGVRIALDDFGTGYSSLGYLRRFPVDKLKIDKSFVQNLGITEDAAAIVECVTRLGRALGLAVTAEGVETGEQHRFVRAVGCHQVQGYLFSPPVEPERVTELLKQDAPVQPRRVESRVAAG